jgi:hypothetical protein
MTTLATRIRELSDKEGFDILVVKNNKPARMDKNGEPPYDFEKKARGTTTVSEWKANRFKKIYPSYECEVLDAQGNHVNGNTLLSTVRQSYEED